MVNKWYFNYCNKGNRPPYILLPCLLNKIANVSPTIKNMPNNTQDMVTHNRNWWRRSSENNAGENRCKMSIIVAGTLLYYRPTSRPVKEEGDPTGRRLYNGH